MSPANAGHDGGDSVHVARWLDLLSRGTAPSLDAFCAEIPPERRAHVRDACTNAARALSLLAPPPPHASRPFIGETVGEYELLSELGRGGMGVVYRARQPSLNREVAVKVLRPEGHRPPRLFDRFRTEALALARVADPRIVKVFNVGEQDGDPYIAMELVDGHSLHEELRRRADPDAGAPALPSPSSAADNRRLAAFFAEIADALQSAHDAGVLHRDVQPKNILVDRHGRPHVIDFGLARLLDEPSQTRSGELAGTPYYMSPEQVRAHRAGLDHRTDVYSLGVVMYEVLTGVRPFDGQTSQQIMDRIVRDTAVPMNRHNPAVPADLVTVCLKAIEKRPQERFASAGELGAELRRVAADRPILTARPGPARRLLRTVRRHPLPFLAVAIAAIAVVLGFALGRPPRPRAVLAILDPAMRGASVLVQEIEPVAWSPGPAISLGDAPIEASLPTGYFRVWIVKGQAFAERTLAMVDAGTRHELSGLRLATADEVRDGMAELPAGVFRFGTDDSDFPGRRAQDVSLPAFLIDECEVSNAQFRRFVEATSAEPPEIWPDDWRANWPSGWDDLPVPGVTNTQATAYAAWAGKRLPTEKEWERAARGAEGWVLPWRPDYERADVLRRANVDREPRPRALDWPTKWLGYLAQIEATRSRPDGRSQAGLHHMVGNLTEWTETRMSVDDEGSVRTMPNMAVSRGAAWDDGADELLTVTRTKYAPLDMNKEWYGFRCAKSLAPPALSQ